MTLCVSMLHFCVHWWYYEFQSVTYFLNWNYVSNPRRVSPHITSEKKNILEPLHHWPSESISESWISTHQFPVISSDFNQLTVFIGPYKGTGKGCDSEKDYWDHWWSREATYSLQLLERFKFFLASNSFWW